MILSMFFFFNLRVWTFKKKWKWDSAFGGERKKKRGFWKLLEKKDTTLEGGKEIKESKISEAQLAL